MWENRYVNDIGNNCLALVDGTNFQLQDGVQETNASAVTSSKGNLACNMKLLLCAFACLGEWTALSIWDYTMISKYFAKD